MPHNRWGSEMDSPYYHPVMANHAWPGPQSVSMAGHGPMRRARPRVTRKIPKPWSAEEEKGFLEGMREFGHSWSAVSAKYVPTRSPEQLASHAQKYFARQKRLAARKEAAEREAEVAESSSKATTPTTEPSKLQKMSIESLLN
eukprot:CAMPEP_0114554128 /NCGR_PEP_ID=MMETSP0114-20121206/8042_1 /TAXON_ID=31324 /ORGANISM="Goniomonas sp, Strain m" /LENGTH=142 /DNA_ID=CAMNT_0001739149 /DNA_START=106 /DNA_END=534 /DNA_ORIENTATION=+